MSTRVSGQAATQSRAVAPAFTIARGASESGPRVDVDLVQAHMSRLLGKHLSDIELDVDTPAIEEGRRTYGGFGSAAALDRHIAEWRLQQRTALPRTMDLVVPVGNRLLAPPYDHDWATGAAEPLARLDGSILTFGDDGFSANGVSVVLSSTEPLLTSVTPQGSFDFSWASFENYPTLSSRGGLGILVYENANPAPIVERQSVLWSLAGVARFTSDHGSGRFADATSPSGGPFPPMRLAPVLINMMPGAFYEVWMWVWQVAHYGVASPAFLSVVRCKLPFVEVDAGPPIVIH